MLRQQEALVLRGQGEKTVFRRPRESPPLPPAGMSHSHEAEREQERTTWPLSPLPPFLVAYSCLLLNKSDQKRRHRRLGDTVCRVSLVGLRARPRGAGTRLGWDAKEMGFRFQSTELRPDPRTIGSPGLLGALERAQGKQGLVPWAVCTPPAAGEVRLPESTDPPVSPPAQQPHRAA